ATVLPNIMTKEINSFTFLELRLLLNPSASPNMAPPKVALPTSEENDEPNNPTKNNVLAYFPNKGSKAFPISAALATWIPLGNNTAAAQINTAALIPPRMATPVNAPCSDSWRFTGLPRFIFL